MPWLTVVLVPTRGFPALFAVLAILVFSSSLMLFRIQRLFAENPLEAIERYITLSETATGFYTQVLHLSSPVKNFLREIDGAIKIQILDTGRALVPFRSHRLGFSRQDACI